MKNEGKRAIVRFPFCFLTVRPNEFSVSRFRQDAVLFHNDFSADNSVRDLSVKGLPIEGIQIGLRVNGEGIIHGPGLIHIANGKVGIRSDDVAAFLIPAKGLCAIDAGDFRQPFEGQLSALTASSSSEP